MNNMSETIQNQEKKIQSITRSLERDQEDDIDPYINLNTKQQRMPYHQPKVYKPLTSFENHNPVRMSVLIEFRTKVLK